MVVKRKFSVGIVDIEKIEEINNIILKYAASIEQHSTYDYFHLRPMNIKDVNQDVTVFYLEVENESERDKILNDLVEELNQLNTLYSLRDEDTGEIILIVEDAIALVIKFDNVKFMNEGTYEKIDAFNHLKTEFGICKNYNPRFRSVENISIENKPLEPETIYLFSESPEDLSKLKTLISQKIMEIDSNIEIETKYFEFLD